MSEAEKKLYHPDESADQFLTPGETWALQQFFMYPEALNPLPRQMWEHLSALNIIDKKTAGYLRLYQKKFEDEIEEA